MHRINQVKTSLIAESARWGDYPFSFTNPQGQNAHIADNNWDVNSEFTTELNRMRNDYFPQRTTNMISYYKNNDITSDLSSIYYTLDGTDPRAVGGGISNSAILYSGPINLPNGVTTIKARVRDNNHTNADIRKWSAMCPRTFYIAQNYSDIVINEIHYNPSEKHGQRPGKPC